MAPTRIGLMGFGRIGRNLFRLLYEMEDVRVGAICDVAEPKALEYLLRFDTIEGRFPDELSIGDGHLYVAGQQIPFLEGGEPGEISWRELGVDIVVEATGQPRDRETLERHLEQGAERVILCSPPLDEPDITIVMGVNDDRLERRHRIVSNGSCTAHCAAPILKILNEAFGIERAFLNSVHAYTSQQRLADVPMAEPRRGRAGAENIIPQKTQTAKLIEQLMPELEGRLSASAMNVPVANGSLVDLVCWHESPVKAFAINEVVRTAVAAHWQGIVEYEEEPIVSTDVLQSPYSSTFDAQATMVLGDRISKTLSWFDNSWGYVNRVVDLIACFRDLDSEISDDE